MSSLKSMRSSGIHLRVNPQEMFKIWSAIVTQSITKSYPYRVNRPNILTSLNQLTEGEVKVSICLLSSMICQFDTFQRYYVKMGTEWKRVTFFLGCRMDVMEISFCSHPNTNKVIATIFGTWHDSWAVVACAKFCCDVIISNWIRAKWNFHHIWIVMEKSLVKWVPALIPILSYISY